MKRAVFLDRDGVINKSLIVDGIPKPPQNLENLEILSGVKVALKELKESGFLLIVVTNQPDVSRGTITLEEVQLINEFLSYSLPIDAFFMCVHDDEDFCSCRKPKPGLLVEAAVQHGIDIKSSFLVGDRWRDIVAGQAVGCACYFIDHGYSEKSPPRPFERVHSLLDASRKIIGDESYGDTK
jgi:D-glycero-D-manno-heptose 1,7-bisphosphate phosphatase